MKRDRQIFSYVVDHDYGFAPNPDSGLCSLARCKFGSPEKANLVEKARVDDWIIGTVGKNNANGGSSILMGEGQKVPESISFPSTPSWIRSARYQQSSALTICQKVEAICTRLRALRLTLG